MPATTRRATNPASGPLAYVADRQAAPGPSAPARVTLHTLGECRITVEHRGGSVALTPASDRLFTLALLLAAEPGRQLPRTRAANWLWPDLPTDRARHALRQLVYRLRQLGAAVDGDDATLTLAREYIAVDAPTGAGRCLPDWHPAGDELNEWVDRYRARTEADARCALARALEDARATNRDATALAAALLELDPQHPLARIALPRPTAVRETPKVALPFTGRGDLLATVRAHAAAARDGHGSAIALSAAPGAGAARTLHELAAVARAHGLHTPKPAGGTTPGLTTGLTTGLTPAADFADALALTVRALLDCHGALGADPVTLRTVRRLTATRTLPTGPALLRRLGASIAELARAVAAERPLLLSVDAPFTTVADRMLATAVARGLTTAPALATFVVPSTTTPDGLAPLRSAIHVVELHPLAHDDAARLATLAARSRGDMLSPADLAWCVAFAGGRPGDVIALAECCAAQPGARTLPPSVERASRDRLAGLPTRTRTVAALGAILRTPLDANRIALTLGRHRNAVDAALTQLRRAGLPSPITRPPAPGRSDRDLQRDLSRHIARTLGALALTTLDPADREALTTVCRTASSGSGTS